jgi:hypothetical protein
MDLFSIKRGENEKEDHDKYGHEVISFQFIIGLSIGYNNSTCISCTLHNYPTHGQLLRRRASSGERQQCDMAVIFRRLRPA